MNTQLNISDAISTVELAPLHTNEKVNELQFLSVEQILRDFPNQTQMMRNQLYAELAEVSPNQRTEFICKLKEELNDYASKVLPGNTLKGNVNERLQEFDEMVQDPEIGNQFERLLALLMELILLFGKVHTERQTISAKMGELSMEHAKFAGADGVQAAESNLYGAIAAFGIGTAVAAGGMHQVNKGTKIKINDIRTNRSDVAKLNHEYRNATHSGRKHVFADADDPQVKLNKMRAENGMEFSIEERNTLQPNDHDPVYRNLSDNLADIDHKNNLSEISRARGDQLQQSGHTISAMVMPVTQMASTGFGMEARAHEADAKINDVQHDVSSNIQNNESQNSQRTTDQLAKILDIIAAIKETSHRTINDISSSIRA